MEQHPQQFGCYYAAKKSLDPDPVAPSPQAVKVHKDLAEALAVTEYFKQVITHNIPIARYAMGTHAVGMVQLRAEKRCGLLGSQVVVIGLEQGNMRLRRLRGPGSCNAPVHCRRLSLCSSARFKLLLSSPLVRGRAGEGAPPGGLQAQFHNFFV